MTRMLLLIALLTGQNASPPPAQAGLLLGVASGVSEDDTELETLWIAPAGSEWRALAQGRGLLVPRKSGFWWVGIHPPTPADWFDTFLWAAPVGKPLVVTGPGWEDVEERRRFGGVHRIGLTFVGPDYVSAAETFEVYGPQLAYNHLLNVFSLDQLTKPAIADAAFFGAEIDDVLGRGSQRILDLAAQAAAKSGIDEFHTEEFVSNASINWSIARNRGGWEVLGRAGHGTGALRGYDFDYDVPITPSPTVTGPSRQPPPWNAIFDRVPDATDAITSPPGDVVVVVTPNRLWVYSVANGRLASRLGVIPLSADNRRIVMAQWATGTSVARWTREVVPLLQSGIPKVQDQRQKH